MLVTIQQLGRLAKSYDSGQAKRASENRDVGGARASVGRDTDDRVPIELHRKTRREIVGDQNLVRSLGQIDGIVVGQT